MAQRSIELGSFAPGVNNRLEPTQLAKKLPDGTMGQYLYGADNVDINEKGYLKRRQGQTLTVAGEARSLWADTQGGFVVLDDTLKSFTINDAGSFAGVSIVSNLPPPRLSYSRGADGDVYWSNAVSLRRVHNNVDKPVVTLPPNPAPAVTAGTGALAAGTYLIATTRLSEDGESPATPVVAIALGAGGGVVVTSSETIEVYMSAPDGDILTLQASGVTGSITIGSHNESARRCMTLNRAVMPPGQIVRHYRGSLLVASANILYISDPYNYGVYNPSKGYIPFPANIDMLEPTDNALYIAADKTYWIGNLLDDTLQEVLPYGAVPYTSGQHPNNESVFWQSPRGLVIADKNQSVKNVQEEALQFGHSDTGASIFREFDGMSHIVTTRSGAQPSTGIASSYADAEVIRQGTIL